MKKTATLLSLACAAALTASADDTRLVLQITVDGLRYDLIERYGDRFVEGGIRMLQKEGVVYSNAHYLHANTETIVGHATLATGTTPALHGMIGNAWFDKDTGQLRYNIEDSEAQPLPTRDDAEAGGQVDPAQMVDEKGRSPRSMLAPTFGDTLSAYTGGKSKVFGISGKDRAAVSMAGYTGKAFWFSTDSGDFITSEYYYDAYPKWAAEWNAQRKANAYAGTDWTLLNAPESYLFIDQDDREYEVDLKGFGITFPHTYAKLGHPLFYTHLLVSPVGDQLTLDFAKALIEGEQLGQDEVPDYLSISFSGVDAVNHFFGPSSLENEDVTLQVDATIAELLKFVDDTVGLEHTIIAFSADHGMPDMPEYVAGMGFPADRMYGSDIHALANEVAAMHGSPWRYDTHVPIIFMGEGIKAQHISRRVHPEDVAPTLSALLGMSPPSSAVGTVLTEVAEP